MRLILQHHPARAYLLERTAVFEPIVVTDPAPDDPKRSPWRTYRECLRTAAALDEPSVIIQDDCVPVPGFLEAATSARTAVPGGIICFCVQGMLQRSRTSYMNALARGPSLVQLFALSWVPALAIGWTPELAACATLWSDTQRRSPRWDADDAVLASWANYCRVDVWATAPSLVDHPDDVPSVMKKQPKKMRVRPGGRPNRRPIALYSGNAADVVFAAP